MPRKTSQFLTKEQRLRVYRQVRKVLTGKERTYIGFCKSFQIALTQIGFRTKWGSSNLPGKPMDSMQFDADNNANLRKNYPEIARRKPARLRSSAYWFSPDNTRKNAPRIRIIDEAIKEIGG